MLLKLNVYQKMKKVLRSFKGLVSQRIYFLAEPIKFLMPVCVLCISTNVPQG